MVFEPNRQGGFKEFAAQLIARQPDGLEHGQQFGGVVDDFRAGSFPNPAAHGRFSIRRAVLR